MPEILVSLLAGLSVPVAALLFKYFLDLREKRSSRIVNVTDTKGKVFSILVEGKTDARYIGKVLENEYLLEDKVEKILTNYKKKHSNFNFHKNHHVDFLLEFNDKTIAVEVKSSGSVVQNEYIKNIKVKYPEVSELLLIFDSDIPSNLQSRFSDDNFVKFVTSPRGKALKEKVVNVLDEKISNFHHKAFKNN